MVQLSDQINRKKADTARLEKDNKELNQKYEETTQKIKLKEKEIISLQMEFSLAAKDNENLSFRIEAFQKEKGQIKEEENLGNDEKGPEGHYQRQSDVGLVKEEDWIVNEKIDKEKHSACLSFCQCKIY